MVRRIGISINHDPDNIWYCEDRGDGKYWIINGAWLFDVNTAADKYPRLTHGTLVMDNLPEVEYGHGCQLIHEYMGHLCKEEIARLPRLWCTAPTLSDGLTDYIRRVTQC